MDLQVPQPEIFMPATRLLLAALGIILLAPSSPITGQDSILKENGELRWRRGNMHTHSLWSDGDHYPEMIAIWYRDHGYQFLVFTDHNTLLKNEKWVDVDKPKGGRPAFDALKTQFQGDWVVTRQSGNKLECRLKTFDEIYSKMAVPQEFLLIQGEEITDSYKTKPIHLCATNTAELLPPTGGDSVTDVMQRNIDASVARRERSGVKTLVHLNHPNFGYAITAEQLMLIVGENFFEVYNGHPTVHNSGDESHASTERMWDIINTFRLSKLDLPLMYGLATDDGHNYFEKQPAKAAQPGRGWVMVLTESLTPDAIVESLESGKFYSSSGVTLKEIRHEVGRLFISVKTEADVSYQIDFVGTPRTFDAQSTPASDDPARADDRTRKYSADVGTVLRSVEGPTAEYSFTGTELYVRAVITASRLHPNPSEAGEFERAWTQPVVPLPAR